MAALELALQPPVPGQTTATVNPIPRAWTARTIAAPWPAVCLAIRLGGSGLQPM